METNLRDQNGNGPVAAERMERRPITAPPVDIYENADEILVVADVPGARSDSIMVKVEKNELYLHARREGNGGPAGFRTADYTRTFLVPRGIDAEKITAEMNAGVLRIHLPKSEALKPRRIAVRAG
jgi:HSP20 family molecular chaperone IbpA